MSLAFNTTDYANTVWGTVAIVSAILIFLYSIKKGNDKS